MIIKNFCASHTGQIGHYERQSVICIRVIHRSLTLTKHVRIGKFTELLKRIQANWANRAIQIEQIKQIESNELNRLLLRIEQIQGIERIYHQFTGEIG